MSNFSFSGLPTFPPFIILFSGPLNLGVKDYRIIVQVKTFFYGLEYPTYFDISWQADTIDYDTYISCLYNTFDTLHISCRCFSKQSSGSNGGSHDTLNISRIKEGLESGDRGTIHHVDGGDKYGYKDNEIGEEERADKSKKVEGRSTILLVFGLRRRWRNDVSHDGFRRLTNIFLTPFLGMLLVLGS